LLEGNAFLASSDFTERNIYHFTATNCKSFLNGSSVSGWSFDMAHTTSIPSNSPSTRRAERAAQEVSELKHGLLTYVLVEEGLKQGRAEQNDKGEITERKWLDYATQRVPGKELEKMKERDVSLKDGTVQINTSGQNSRGTQLVFAEGDDPKLGSDS
jgi:hypothetical protein